MIGQVIIVSSILATGGIFFRAQQDLSFSWLLLAQLTGVFGLLGLSWSYILSVRHQFLENFFGGLDKIYRLHHIIGGASLILLINHPVFLIVNNLPVNTLNTYLLPGKNLSYDLGIIALYLLILLLVFTLYVDLPYWFWKKTHEWMGLIILLGGAHSMLVPSSLTQSLSLKIWLLAWIILAGLSFFYKRYLYYWLLPKNNYQIDKIEMENDIAFIDLSPVSPLKIIQFRPGQFGFMDINRPGRSRDEHPFSIINLAAGKIQIGAKIVGDFTSALLRLNPGDLITLRGPFGSFGSGINRAKNLIWIAGGIGITPFVSLLQVIVRDQKVAMFYSSKDAGPGKIISRFELFGQEHANFQWYHFISKLHGRLTSKHLLNCGLFSPQTIFLLCGPIAMMTSLSNQLQTLGVKRKRIIFEDFNFR